MDIPFHNFKFEYKRRETEFMSAVRSVLDTGTYILGSNVKSFEIQFAHYLQLSNFCGVGNGTDAITIAAKAIDIKPGDEVIIPAITAYATVIGIEKMGATPIIADVDYDTGLIDPIDIEKKITKRTKAIVPVHLYGQICDMSKIQVLAKHYHLKIIEDCAHAVGAKQFGINAGHFGNVAAFSFYPTKNLGALGDGGGIATKNNRVYLRCTYMRNYGQVDKYKYVYWGINSRLDEIQAALLLVNMRYLSKDINKRMQIAMIYNKYISTVKPLKTLKNNLHAYHLYVVKTRNRAAFIKHLQSRHIETIIHYPVPSHLQKAFKYKSEQLPRAERLCKEIVSIPLHSHLTHSEVEYIIDAINSFHSK